MGNNSGDEMGRLGGGFYPLRKNKEKLDRRNHKKKGSANSKLADTDRRFFTYSSISWEDEGEAGS